MYRGGDQNFLEAFFQHDDVLLVDETRRPLKDEHKQLTVLNFAVFKPAPLYQYLTAVLAARTKLNLDESTSLKGSSIFSSEASIEKYDLIVEEIFSVVESKLGGLMQVAYTQKHLTKTNSEIRTDLNIDDEGVIKTVYGDELVMLLNSIRDVCKHYELGKSVGVIIDASGRFGPLRKKLNLEDGEFSTLLGFDGATENQEIDLTFVSDKGKYFNELILIADSIGYLGLIKGDSTHLEANAKDERHYPAFRNPVNLDLVRAKLKKTDLDKKI